MKWIKYKIKQCTVDGEDVLVNKKVGYSEANLAIAQNEAYDGYEIIDDDKTIDNKPLAIEFGGTGASDAANVRANLGIKSEPWTLTYEDGTVETKVVYVG